MLRQTEKLHKAIESAYNKEEGKEAEGDEEQIVKELEVKIMAIQDNAKKIDKAEKVHFIPK